MTKLPPRTVDLKNEGILYSEYGPNQGYMNIVEATDAEGNPIIDIVAAITENEMMNSFTSATFGKVIVSISFVEIFRKLEEQLRNQHDKE